MYRYFRLPYISINQSVRQSQTNLLSSRFQLRTFSAYQRTTHEAVQATPGFIPAAFSKQITKPENQIEDQLDLSCLFQRPRSEKYRHEMEESLLKKMGDYLPHSWIRNQAPSCHSLMFVSACVLLLVLACSVHILPLLGKYSLSRDFLTLLLRFSGLIFIAQSGAQVGLNLSRYGWAPKLTRLQGRYSVFRSAAAGILMMPSITLISMADFTARDATYLGILTAFGLTVLDYVVGRQKLQPVWFFPTMITFRIWMIVTIIAGVLSERIAVPGNQIGLVKIEGETASG